MLEISQVKIGERR